MVLLSETLDREVNFILSPHNYIGLYNKLKRYLPEYYTFFARPTKVGNKTKWYFETNKKYKRNQIKSFNELSEELKDTVSDYIEEIKPEISEILKRKSDVKNFYNSFFKIIEEDDIKVIETEYEPIIILTQWACEPNSVETHIDPLNMVINRPRPDRTRVIIEIKYSDGSIANDRKFYYHYKTFDRARKTNQEGLYNFGRFKFGSQISVYDLIDGKKKSVHDITVTEGKEKYEIIFPLFTKAKVKVINQKKKVIPNVDINVEYEDEIQIKNTGKFGFFNINDIEVGKEIKISEKENPKNSKTYKIQKNKNEYILEILEPFYSDAKIKVVNQNGEILPNRLLLIQHEGKDYEKQENEYISDDEGIIELKNILEGSQITATEKDNPKNVQTYILTEENNEFLFEIFAPPPKFVKIKLVNRKFFWQKYEIMKGITIDFTYNGETRQALTNEEGICILPEGSFINKEKVKTSIHLPKKKKKRKKNKNEKQ